MEKIVTDQTLRRTVRYFAVCLLLSGFGCGSREPEPSPAARQEIANAAAAERQGDWNTALTALEAARKTDPNTPLPLLEAGRLLEKMGFFTEAVAAYEEAARRAPKSPRPWLRLADLYRRSERSALVGKSIEAALAVAPRDPDALVAAGRERLGRNDLWAAARALGDALEARPNDSEALGLIGVLERRRQALGEAESALRRAIELNPGNVEARLELGGLYRDLDRAPDAIAVLEPALATADDPAIPYELSRLYQKVGRGAEGLKLSQQHLQMTVARDEPRGLREQLWTEPRMAELRSRLAASFLAAGQLAEAEGICQGWLRFEPDSAAAWNGLASARLAGKDRAGAIAAIEKALARWPEDVPSLLRLATLSAQSGDAARAKSLFDKAVAIDPNHPMLLSMLAGGTGEN